MEISFDGIRKRLANQFNELAATELSINQRHIMMDLQGTIGGILSMYSETAADCHDLSEIVHLKDVSEGL